MAAKRLAMHRVEKPWGRHQLWPGFADPAPGADPIGEIWFQDERDDSAELLVKYLFTSQKLSIQVHPNDAAARAAGHPRGKDEAWLVLAADAGACVGLGTRRALSDAELRAAALDGSIEALVDWKPVAAGDFIYSPAGTVHAIGPGLTLIEIQQNVDLTYRLYDYGRPRELHLDAGIAAADARPFAAPNPPSQPEGQVGRSLLAEGPKFVVERRRGGDWSVDLGKTPAWLVPVAGTGSVDGVEWQAGDCLALEGRVAVHGDAEADLLLAYPGARRI